MREEVDSKPNHNINFIRPPGKVMKSMAILRTSNWLQAKNKRPMTYFWSVSPSSLKTLPTKKNLKGRPQSKQPKDHALKITQCLIRPCRLPSRSKGITLASFPLKFGKSAKDSIREAKRNCNHVIITRGIHSRLNESDSIAS